ncbi:hypothetical protein BTUL_0086g00180 [Botrytis tulipae]|uniref:Uncharacterized protein n=1 Tax=Botrytis tulipae TaxID=87230 RepID=A0A4Z1EQ91_9HELO|nr:hypothetical protein BTUL_0086g00180 [Botrytis tulipae]
MAREQQWRTKGYSMAHVWENVRFLQPTKPKVDVLTISFDNIHFTTFDVRQAMSTEVRKEPQDGTALPRYYKQKWILYKVGQ